MLSEKVDVLWAGQRGQPLTPEVVVPRTDSSGGLEWTTDDANAMTRALGRAVSKLVAMVPGRSSAIGGASSMKCNGEVCDAQIHVAMEQERKHHESEKQAVSRSRCAWKARTVGCLPWHMHMRKESASSCLPLISISRSKCRPHARKDFFRPHFCSH